MGRSFGYAAAGLGYVLALTLLSFLLGGGGHGTSLFGLIALAPGSLAGDNPWAMTGFLFWAVIGFLVGLAPRRGAQILIVLLMLAHYAVAAVQWTHEGRDGGAGFMLSWDKVPVHVTIFCLLYLAGNLVVWVLAFRKRAGPA